MHHPPAPRRDQDPAVEPVHADVFEGGSGDVVSSGTAAVMLGISRQRVAQQIASGRFATAALVDGRWMIDRAEIDWMLS